MPSTPQYDPKNKVTTHNRVHEAAIHNQSGQDTTEMKKRMTYNKKNVEMAEVIKKQLPNAKGGTEAQKRTSLELADKMISDNKKQITKDSTDLERARKGGKKK